jgi:DNA repair photolyase
MNIYTPAGRAREYSPKALNHYAGCTHGCTYCYVVPMMKKFKSGYDQKNVIPRFDVLKGLEKSALKAKEQVLLSFTCDPYSEEEPKHRLTRRVLEIFAKCGTPTAILSKGGVRSLADMDILKSMGKRVKLGATLSCMEKKTWIEWEPGAASPEERLNALKKAHESGIETWASLEPVIKSEETLELIKESNKFVDGYKVGKMNYQKIDVDWQKFLLDSVKLLRKLGKRFYIKDELAKHAPEGFVFVGDERNADAHAIKGNP